jgi:hypothetical protein
LRFLRAFVGGAAADGPWRWYRAAAIGFAIAFLLLIGKAAWANFANLRATDFVSFWAAARLAIEGHAPLAYDVAAHRQVALTAASLGGNVVPFPYPPPFLLFVVPFGLVPYWLGFVLWLAATGGLYLLASRPLTPPYYALAHPAVALNGMIGQNGFLTAGIFMAGASRLGTAPVLAGAIWGLLAIKPQLALLLPVALIAGREWKAIAGGALSAAALSLLALLLLGTGAWRGFFEILAFYASWMAQGAWPWRMIASPFGVLRYFQVPQAAALLVHAAIALGAAWVTWRAWARRLPQRMPVLAAATLLVSPYALSYDSLLLLVPLAWLIAERRQPWAVAAIWLCLLPVGLFDGVYAGPNTVPLACLLSLWALHRERAVPAAGQRAPLGVTG